MASIGPHIPAHLRSRNPAQPESAAEQPEAGPSIDPVIPAAQTPSATITPPTLSVPRYEEEEEEEEEDADEYAPELPPELAAARANPSGGPPRRAIGPPWGPLRREEEEEESEDEIGPAPPPARHACASDAREDAVTEFMQKEAQRRQAIEVRLAFTHTTPPFWFIFSSLRCACSNAFMHLRTCQLYSSPPLLHRRRRDQRRFSVMSGCSSRLHLRTC